MQNSQNSLENFDAKIILRKVDNIKTFMVKYDPYRLYCHRLGRNCRYFVIRQVLFYYNVEDRKKKKKTSYKLTMFQKI